MRGNIEAIGLLNGWLLLKIREAEIARGLAGLDDAGGIESFPVGGWFTRDGLGASDAMVGVTRPGATAGSTLAQTRARLLEDARAKLARETAQRQTAQAAGKVAETISTKLIENLRAASDLAERQYRVGALGVSLLVEATANTLTPWKAATRRSFRHGATASTWTF